MLALYQGPAFRAKWKNLAGVRFVSVHGFSRAAKLFIFDNSEADLSPTSRTDVRALRDQQNDVWRWRKMCRTIA